MKRSRREDMLKPVQKVEVSDKHVALRIVLFILALLIAIGAFTYALTALLRVPSGWMQIEAAATEISVAPELSFYYYVGSDGRDAKAEKNAVTNAYTEACVNAYKMFDTVTDNQNNVCAVNIKVNETVTVDAALYRAFKTVADYDARLLFMAPIYERRSNIFFSADDFGAQQFDPNFSMQEKTFYDEILEFVNSSADISLDILEQNSVRLNVSARYLAYAKESGIKSFVDFFHMKNAFIVDYIVGALTEKGYNVGFISSIDGFTRTLSGEMADNSITLFDKVGDSPYACAAVTLKQSFAGVNLHGFKIRAGEQYYYKYSDGRIVTPFVSADGKETVSSNFIFGYSKDGDCGSVLIEMLPLFMSEQLNVADVKALSENGIDTVYAKDKTVYYTQSGLDIVVNQKDDSLKYVKQLVE